MQCTQPHPCAYVTLREQVVPFLELAADQGQDLEAPQYGQDEGLPRLFKSHAWAGHCPKGIDLVVLVVLVVVIVWCLQESQCVWQDFESK